MKEKELRDAAICAVCERPFGNAGLPMFWRVKIERHGIKLDAINRQQGLTMMMGGNASLAAVMGPDENMTEPMMDPVEITICEDCCCKQVVIAEIAERFMP